MNEYQEKLKHKMNEYAHFVYRVTKNFPKHELYGITSQIRRASLSVVLNYIEGYARKKPRVRLNFLETSYASLKESKYVLHFSLIEKYLTKDDYKFALGLAEEIGAMLWIEIENLERSIKL
ncbi:four helix bundle protein [Candidatus Falkowbacteria bacterium]|nr:four helix bundle protein [Candidatus Falkowbacteria bacterium]